MDRWTLGLSFSWFPLWRTDAFGNRYSRDVLCNCRHVTARVAAVDFLISSCSLCNRTRLWT